MALTINTNMNSLVAQNNLATNQTALATAMQRLSSGLRINSAADDAAGLSISARMTAQINGSDQAGRNANDGISLAQTAGGALSQIAANLQTMRTLAVQSANGTNSTSDRAALNAEFQALSSEIQRVAQSASFNGVNLLDGTFTAQSFQVGANAGAANVVTVPQISSAQTTALGGSAATVGSTVTGGVTTAPLAAGNLTLNGFQVGASVAGTAAGQTADSAYAIAAAINAVSAQSGVTATANPASITGTAASMASGALAAGSFSINGVSVGAIVAGGSAVGQGANAAAAINQISAQTGVTATADATSGAVTLTAADGRDISLTLGTGTAATVLAATGLVAPGTTTGKVTLTSNNAAGIVVSGGAVANAGLTAGTTAPSTTLAYQTVAQADILTTSDSSQALSTIDGALATINASQAELGAVQNRFSSVVTDLQTTSQNLTASRSRIQDADFAAETAALSRSQILQQAGTMVAQATSLPQGVLTLLK